MNVTSARRHFGARARRALAIFASTSLAFGAAVVTATPAGAATGPAVYSAVPAPSPPNVPSIGFQATQTDEFGDEVGLVSHATPLATARVLMSSWGCESGTWNGGDCATTPGLTFSVPITFNVYAVNNSVSPPAPGALLGSRTQTFAIPYRPSASASCTTAGQWFSGGSCYNGLAVPITFDFSSGPQVALPAQVIWTVSFNTTNYGPSPIGTSACSVTPQGCGYDSLNVGLNTSPPGPSVGTDTDPDAVFWNTHTAGNYTDGGAGGTGTLREDTAWSPYVPAGELQLAAPPPPPPHATVPGPPGKVTSQPRNGGAMVHWSAPTDNGGSPINGYLVTPLINGVAQPVQTFDSTANSELISGLKNGVAYKFRVAARNAVGVGAKTKTLSPITVGAPGAPGRPTVTHPAPGSLRLKFHAATGNGARVGSYRGSACRAAARRSRGGRPRRSPCPD